MSRLHRFLLTSCMAVVLGGGVRTAEAGFMERIVENVFATAAQELSDAVNPRPRSEPSAARRSNAPPHQQTAAGKITIRRPRLLGIR